MFSQNFREILTKTLSVTLAISVISPLQAADFTIESGQVATTVQAIGTAANETGTIEEGGEISITGGIEHAITSSSEGGTINNSGTISIAGDNVNAININSFIDSNSINNNGTITTNGSLSHAISAYGNSDNSSIINNGNISILGDVSFGFYVNGQQNVIVNNATLTTAGDTGVAALIAGGNSSFTNNGTITTTGDSAYGILNNFGSRNIYVNNGTVTTSGNNAHAILLHGDDNIITNNGRAIASGTGAAALSVSNLSGTIINQGYAKSLAGDTASLTANDSTLIIKNGSLLDGTVLFSGSGERILQYDVAGIGKAGGVLAITGEISGSPDTNIINGGTLPTDYKIVQGDNIVAVVTPDQFSSSQTLITQMVNDVDNLVNNRQQLALLRGVQQAERHSQNDVANETDNILPENGNIAWGEVFGSYQKRGQTSDSADSITRSGGFLVGVDLPKKGNNLQAGYYMGGFGGSLDLASFRDVDSRGGLVGGYISKNHAKYFITGNLNLGFSKNDTTRLTGADTAQADYTSYFLTPSLTVMRPVNRDAVTFIPNLTLRYTGQYDRSYTETGSVANQRVAARKVHMFGAKAMIDARLKAKQLHNGSLFKANFRTGVRAQSIISGGKTNITILSNNISLNPEDDDNLLDGILGINLSLSEQEKLTIYLDAETNLGLKNGVSDDDKGYTARAGLQWKF